MSMYKVVTESQIKRLRQLGYAIVPTSNYRYTDPTDYTPENRAPLHDAGCTIPLDNLGAPVEAVEVTFPAQGSQPAPAAPSPVHDSPEAPEARPEPPVGDGDASAAELIARHRGRGSYSIMRGDEEVIEGLHKDEAARFNAMGPFAKAAYVAERKPAK